MRAHVHNLARGKRRRSRVRCRRRAAGRALPVLIWASLLVSAGGLSFVRITLHTPPGASGHPQKTSSKRVRDPHLQSVVATCLSRMLPTLDAADARTVPLLTRAVAGGRCPTTRGGGFSTLSAAITVPSLTHAVPACLCPITRRGGTHDVGPSDLLRYFEVDLALLHIRGCPGWRMALG